MIHLAEESPPFQETLIYVWSQSRFIFVVASTPGLSFSSSSTLQMRDGQSLHIAYCKADKDVLVLALPADR